MPKQMSTEEIEGQLELIYSAAMGKVEDIAEEYRENVLLPLCKKRDIEYLSGNGTTCFYVKRKGKSVGISTEHDAVHEKTPYLA